MSEFSESPCPKCGENTWVHRDGTRPFSHRFGLCKEKKQ